MPDKTVTGRRKFLKTVALAGGMAQAQAGEAQTAAQGESKSPAAPATPAPARQPIEYPRVFAGRQLSMIAFPLGGVGAGSVSLGGRGQLSDWEIFNRADKGKAPAYSFPCIWAKTANGKPVARVLEARLQPPYEATQGLNPAGVPGLSRLESATFTGEYPLAKVAFHDRKLPVRVTLEAFTPIAPLDAEDSGLPVAVLRYRVHNPARQRSTVSIAFSLDNPVGIDSRARNQDSTRPPLSSRRTEFRDAGLRGLWFTNPGVAADAPMAGSLALCLLNPGDGKVTWLRGWPRAKWWASPLLFWDDFSQDGQLGPETPDRNGVASLCLEREIAAGGEAEYTFLLAWHFPNRTPAWCGWAAPAGEANTIIGNHYCQRFPDAWQAAEYTAANLPPLEKRMRQFLAAVRETTVPAAVKDAAMANLSTLATPVCFRTADGRFRGFEGANDDSGCCHGNCTHVWNYESTSQHLFPSLARSMREAAFELGERMDGVIPIRVALPEGKQTAGTTAADGTMGQIIKANLDWRLTGDDAWLRAMWPKIRKALEFAWVEGGWDGDRDGVAEGVQHNTYDVEFYGPNPMCGIYYLGALRAAEEMARAVGEAPFAAECARLRANGSRWIDENLFQGEYYVQKVRGIPEDKIARPLRSRGGADDPEHPDFQVGEGCLLDQLVGQYVAELAGLGPLVSTDHIRKTLESIHRYNLKPNLYEHDSVERIYAINDEASLVVCEYGSGPRPRIPFPYSSEVWTGLEYLAAALMMYYGMVDQGVETVENARRRYDGERRNPWNEVECGRHYVRAMAAWSGMLALSGFRYHGAEKSVAAAPRIHGANFSSFWSAGGGWGTFAQSVREGRVRFTLAVEFGKLECRSVELAHTPAAGAQSTARLRGKPLDHKIARPGGRLVFVLAQTAELGEGEELVLSV